MNVWMYLQHYMLYINEHRYTPKMHRFCVILWIWITFSLFIYLGGPLGLDIDITNDIIDTYWSFLLFWSLSDCQEMMERGSTVWHWSRCLKAVVGRHMCGYAPSNIKFSTKQASKSEDKSRRKARNWNTVSWLTKIIVPVT